MKSFIAIVAASAVLSAGLVAGLSAGLVAADATPPRAAPAKTLTDRLPVEAPASSGWVDPPARGAAKGTIKGAVRTSVEPGAGRAAEAPARTVRVIAVEGRPGLATPARVPGKDAPSTALALR